MKINYNHCKPIKKGGKSLKINTKQQSKNPISCPGMKQLTGIGRWNDFHMCFGQADGIRFFRMKNNKIIENHLKSEKKH